MCLPNTANEYKNNLITPKQALYETGIGFASTYGGLPGTAIGIGNTIGKTISTNLNYRLYVRPILQDVLGIQRDEVPRR